MSGNVLEWCHSLSKSYPYKAGDGREDSQADGLRVLRGGAFVNDEGDVRCADRLGYSPLGGNFVVGFRVVVAPGFL